MLKYLLSLVLLTSMIGCSSTQRGGRSVFTSPSASVSLTQADNPRTTTKQTIVTTKEYRDYALQANTSNEVTSFNLASIRLPARETQTITTELGASYEDTTRKLATKFKAAIPFAIGALVCLAFAGAMFYFGHWEKGAIGIGGFVACTLVYFIAPQLGALGIAAILGIVGILSLLVLAVLYRARWDANKNWIPDALENKNTQPK